jgi:transposase-like protein
MARSELSAPHFQDEQAAFAYVEAHLWPNGPTCPKCGAVDRINRLAPQRTKPSKKHPEGKPVIGLWKCYHCRSQFTVRVGTIFEASHLPLHLWLQIIHLMNASKKGLATRQIQRMLNCSMETAWFLGHRIRETMKDDGGFATPMGGSGRTVEIDQAYVGGRDENRHANKRMGRVARGGKATVFALVEREGGVRAFHIPTVTGANLGDILAKNVSRHTTIYSDSGYPERQAASKYRSAAIDHTSGEYVRGDVHTNTVEGFFAILKRGVTGVYHSVSEAHLQRYLAEFGHRYSNREALGIDDVARASVALKGAKGKRLTYETTRSAGRA